MLDKFSQSIKYTLFPVETIAQAVGTDIAVSKDMYNAIGLWSDMLIDESPWLWDGSIPAESCGLASSITSEAARLATAEFKTEVTGSARADYLQTQYSKVIKDLRVLTEFGAALGGLVIKPYVSGKEIAFDYNHADCFYPIAFDSSGKLSSVVFVEEKTQGNKLYRRLEYHHIETYGCVIDNMAYETSAVNAQRYHLGKPVPLETVQEWQSLNPTTTLRGLDRLLIGYFKMPIANTVDRHSPLGASIYSRAVDNIKECDRQWARILWEYKGSELAVHADIAALKKSENKNIELPAGYHRLYRNMNADKEDLFNVFSPDIRDTSLFNGLNNMLRRVEFQCSLAYGTLSDPQNVEKTAEEIRSSKQRSFVTVCDIQHSLQTMLDDLLYAVDFWTTAAHLAPAGNYEVSYNWGDSILEDREKEFFQRMQLQTASRLKPEINLAWYFGVTEEKAMEMMAKANPGEI